MLKITIDGKEIEFEAGMTILEVAEKANIYIPTLCYIKGLSAYGGCRLCMVKIKGDPKPIQTACSTPALNGMDIITNDAELNEMRKNIIQLLLSEHPSACLVCGNKVVCDDYLSFPDQKPSLRIFGCFSCPNKSICQLQKIVEYLGISELKFPMRYKHFNPTREDLFFESDYNLCITCGKCVRVCSERFGYYAIELVSRGKDSHVAFPENLSRNISDCQYCGGCVDICPVGVYKPTKIQWYKTIETSKKSICGFCSLGCGFQYQIHGGKVINAIPDPEHSVNLGLACIFGRFCAPDFHHSDNRLKYPTIFKDNERVATNIEDIIQNISKLLSKYSPQQIGIIASPNLTNESAYVLNKFAEKILKTQNIGIIDDGLSALTSMIEPGTQRILNSIEKAKWIIIIEANVQLTHPVLFPILKKAKDNGAIISIYSCSDEPLPNQTEYLVNEINHVSAENLNKYLTQFKKSDGCFIIGENCEESVIEKVISISKNNQNITVFPLHRASNYEGVHSIIKKDAAEILNEVNLNKIKALVLTERIDIEIAKKAETIILLDIYPSEISSIASVVLPTKAFLEQQGTYTNIELKDQNLHPIISSPTEMCLEDWEWISKIANGMKPELEKEFSFKNIIEIQRELKTHVNTKQQDLEQITQQQRNQPQKNMKKHQTSIISAKYRGQHLYKVVKDLFKLVELREMIKEKPIGIIKRVQNNLEKDKIIQIELTKEGYLKIGTQTYGLDALKGFVEIESSANNQIHLIIHKDAQNLILLNAEEFCLCNNYRKNLESSHILLDLTQKPYNTTISTFIKSSDKDGKERLFIIPNPIILDAKFKALSESQLNALKPSLIDEINKPDVGMQYRAMKLTHFLLKSRKLYLTTLKSSQIKNATPIKWTIIPTKVKATTSSQAEGVKILDPIQGKLVQSDPKRCMGCGHCAEICPHKAITMKDQLEKRGPFATVIMRYSSIDPTVCYRCAKCVPECPVFAISIFDIEKSKV